MTQPTRPAASIRLPSAPRRAVAFDDIEILACVYGPGSTAADVARMQGVGEGWVRGIAQWQRSGALYLLLVSHNFGGASTPNLPSSSRRTASSSSMRSGRPCCTPIRGCACSKPSSRRSGHS